METPLVISDPSQIAEARRHVVALATARGMSEAVTGRAALIVTEAGTNLLKYGGGGYIVARAFEEDGEAVLEVLALDQGPGIDDFGRSLSDGHSTGGTLGLGLGSISRLASQFDIYTRAGHGTALLARLHEKAPPRPPALTEVPAWRRGLAISGLSTPMAGQDVCGDTWGRRWAGGALWVTVIDGLGHGPMAMHAAQEALRAFHDADEHARPYDVLRSAHAALKSTRGAVMAVAVIRPLLGTLDFAGVGNITAGTVSGDELRRLASTDGTVGYSLRSVREQSYPWTPGATLIMSSDGLSTRWNLTQHPALTARHPSLIAGVMHRDFSRGNDDATVVVVKGNHGA